MGHKVLRGYQSVEWVLCILHIPRKLTNVHWKGTISKGNFIFQPSILRGDVSSSATSMNFPGNAVFQPFFCSAPSHSHFSHSCMAINQAVLAPRNQKKMLAFFFDPKGIGQDISTAHLRLSLSLSHGTVQRDTTVVAHPSSRYLVRDIPTTGTHLFLDFLEGCNPYYWGF